MSHSGRDDDDYDSPASGSIPRRRSTDATTTHDEVAAAAAAAAGPRPNELPPVRGSSAYGASGNAAARPSSRGSLHASSKRESAPLAASVVYPGRPVGMSVIDFLDTSKPLVKSTQPLTKPVGPSFLTRYEQQQRAALGGSGGAGGDQHHGAVSVTMAGSRGSVQAAPHQQGRTASVNAARDNERKYLKAQFEFEREKRIAERIIYQRERAAQWALRLAASPLAVDLVADSERIEEESHVRDARERERRQAAERKRRRIKSDIIVKALAEVPLLDEARRQKRELIEEEKRQKALRDVRRVEAVQARKAKELEQMASERQAKQDVRVMTHAA